MRRFLKVQGLEFQGFMVLGFRLWAYLVSGFGFGLGGLWGLGVYQAVPGFRLRALGFRGLGFQV